MIKSVEIWNLESHKHSRYDFGPGMNLLIGLSDSGKSSTLRAICLAAYNRWHEDMLSIGAKSSRVVVTTERGSVDVERGPSVHRWQVKWMEDGKECCEDYNKLGRGNVPEKATWVLGMPKIEVAGTESLPNTMYQLDKPFLLSEFEGKACSSSVVAQVVDELSGLIGLEALLREINLDLTRSKRLATEEGERAVALSEKKRGLRSADKAKDASQKARAAIAEAQEAASRLEKVEATRTTQKDLKTRLSTVTAAVSVMIDFNACDLLLKEAEAMNTRRLALQKSKDAIDTTRNELLSVQVKRRNMPDCDAADAALSACMESQTRRLGAVALKGKIDGLRQERSSTATLLRSSKESLTRLQAELKVLLQDACPTCGQALSGSDVLHELLEERQ